MPIRKKVYFNKKFAHPYYSPGNSSNTITLSYSVEYLTQILGKKSNQNHGEAQAKKNDTRLAANFTWPAIFAVSKKTQLYAYFYGKDKNPAILLTLLLLALLPRKISTKGGVVIPPKKKNKKQNGENLPSQAIRPIPPPIRVLSRLMAHLRTSATLFGKKWCYGTNLQAIGFLVCFELSDFTRYFI